MRLSKASTYGLFAVLHIAKHGTVEPVQGRAIAKSCGLPLEYLLKILQQLVRARVILSERGRHGGFWMHKSPAETTLLEIVEAVEGTITGQFSVPDAVARANSTKEIIDRLCDRSSQFARSLLNATNIGQLIDAEPCPQPHPLYMSTEPSAPRPSF